VRGTELSRYRVCTVLLAVGAASLPGGAGTASAAAVLYRETFDDDVLAPNTTVRHGLIAGGMAAFNDESAAEGKAGIFVVQGFDTPLMTYSFDVTAPVTGANNDLLFRAGIGDIPDQLGSGDDILEQILHRDGGNRTGYSNTGNESVFVVANNSAGAVNFVSPVDGTSVTLEVSQYAAYVRDNAAGTFVQARGPSAFQTPAGTDITRFGIGNSANARLGTFGIDNVGVVDDISFVSVPEPAGLSLIGGLSALVLGRRRRQAAL
jgi:hypothetical protein